MGQKTTIILNSKTICTCLTFLLLIAVAGPACAVPILYDWYVDVSGTVYEVYPATYTAPTAGGEITDVTGFSAVGPFGNPEGIGSVEVTFTPGAAGEYFVESFFDLEIDEWTNGWDNDSGYVHGTAAAGQYGYADNGVGPDYDSTGTDIKFWMGYDFSLAADEYAVFSFILTGSLPSGFFLEQYDPASGESVYLQGTMDIMPANPVPEPATLLLLGLGLVGLIRSQRRIGR